MTLEDYERREDLASVVKPAAYGDPLDDCLRCGEPVELYSGFDVTWQSKGSAMEGEPPMALGNLCFDCMAELLADWGYEAPPEDREE